MQRTFLPLKMEEFNIVDVTPSFKSRRTAQSTKGTLKQKDFEIKDSQNRAS